MQKLTEVFFKNMWQVVEHWFDIAPAICSAHTKLQWFFMDTQYVILTVLLRVYKKSIPTTNQTELAQLLAKYHHEGTKGSKGIAPFTLILSTRQR